MVGRVVVALRRGSVDGTTETITAVISVRPGEQHIDGMTTLTDEMHRALDRALDAMANDEGVK